MVKVNFNTSDFKRTVTDTNELLLKNRYFEQNPFLTDDGAALIARPGMKNWISVGEGPIRGIFSEPGTFNGDIFVASADTLYRVTKTGVATAIYSGLFNPFRGAVNMAITGNIEDIPEYLYIADGSALLVYDGATVSPVATPDDVGVIDVAVSRSFVVVVPAQGEGINGRFYWINPGEMTIDPLNFATAESAPDAIYGVEALGDNFWLPGQSTTEAWYFTGVADAPVQRLTGVVFDRGTWQGTAVKVKENMVIVDSDGTVNIVGGGIRRVSTPDIEQRIREAMQLQAAKTI